MQVWSLGQEDPLEEGMATHSGIPAWRIPWTEEPDRLQSIGLQKVGHAWSDRACMHMHVYICAFLSGSMSLAIFRFISIFILHVYIYIQSSLWTQTLSCSHETFSWISHRHLRFSSSKAEPLIYYDCNNLIFSSTSTTSYLAAQVTTCIFLIFSYS